MNPIRNHDVFNSLALLRGATETIKKGDPVLAAKVNDTANQSINFLIGMLKNSNISTPVQLKKLNDLNNTITMLHRAISGAVGADQKTRGLQFNVMNRELVESKINELLELSTIPKESFKSVVTAERVTQSIALQTILPKTDNLQTQQKQQTPETRHLNIPPVRLLYINDEARVRKAAFESKTNKTALNNLFKNEPPGSYILVRGTHPQTFTLCFKDVDNQCHAISNFKMNKTGVENVENQIKNRMIKTASKGQ